MESRKVVLAPILSEKGTRLMENNKYLFKVDINANKIQVKKALMDIFDVTVVDVNIIRMKGKVKRVRYKEGKRPDWKKAIVTLKDGDSIDFFESI